MTSSEVFSIDSFLDHWFPNFFYSLTLLKFLSSLRNLEFIRLTFTCNCKHFTVQFTSSNAEIFTDLK